MLPYRSSYDLNYPGTYYGFPRYHDCHDEFHKDCGGVSYACVFCLLDHRASIAELEGTFTLHSAGFYGGMVLTNPSQGGMLTVSTTSSTIDIQNHINEHARLLSDEENK
jgi:hypothetical protein